MRPAGATRSGHEIATALSGRVGRPELNEAALQMIRPEAPSDHEAITEIIIEAFADHPYSHQTEHLIVDELRRSDALTLSLVAEIDGRVVGHVAFSPVKIDGADCRWFALGPVAVARSHQGRGIGQQLITAGLEALRGFGACGCVVVGEPAYNRRFGFEHDPDLMMEGVPPEVFMLLPLAGPRPRGAVSHPPAFSVGL
jgi:putative acetyltransferase